MRVDGELNSAQFEGFDDSGLPDPTLMPRRVVFNITKKRPVVSDGTQWKALGSSGATGGMSWSDGDPAPMQLFEDGILKLVFDQTLAQKATSVVKVPSLYFGSQIFIKFLFESPDTVGNVSWQIVSTLIRKNVDAMADVSNQNAFSQTFTLGAGTAGVPLEVIANLTDATGKINGVSVSPGDILKLELMRVSTDMSALGAKFYAYGEELIFD